MLTSNTSPIAGIGQNVGVFVRADYSDYGFLASTAVNIGLDADVGIATLYTTSGDISGTSQVSEFGILSADFFASKDSQDGHDYYGIGVSKSLTKIPFGASVEIFSHTEKYSCKG